MPALLAALAATALAASTACAAERMPASASAGLRRQLTSVDTEAGVDDAATCGSDLLAFLSDNADLISDFGAFAALGDIDANVEEVGPPVTTLAPSDTAFEAIAGPDPVTAFEGDVELLSEILSGHVLDTAIFTTDLSNGQVLTTVAGTELEVAVANDGSVSLISPNGDSANIIRADIGICTSVAHIIDAVLLTKDQAKRLKKLSRSSTVCGATGEACCAGDSPCKNKTTACIGATSDSAGVCEVCGATGEVCCPGDTACRVGNTVCVGATSESGGVCEVCGATGEVCCAGEKPCRGGQAACVGASSESIGICDDDPEIPCGEQLMNLITDNLELSTFGAVAGPGDIDGTTADAGPPVTIFAPTNAAFEAIAGSDAAAVLSADTDLITEVLAGHLVDGFIATADLTDGQVLTTAAGTTLTAFVSGNGDVLLEGPDDVRIMATIASEDIVVCTSIVHIVDAVFLTPDQKASLAGP